MIFQTQKHHTAFLAHLALKDSDNSLARVLRLCRQGNALYLYFISISPEGHSLLQEENDAMVNQLANNGLAGDGSNICLFNSMYVL
jgi:hypothetical protein